MHLFIGSPTGKNMIKWKFCTRREYIVFATISFKTFFFGIFPISGRCIEFSFPKFSGLVLLLSVSVRLHVFYNSMSTSVLVFLFQFHMMLSEDGSGKGAALVAAVAQRMANEGKTVA